MSENDRYGFRDRLMGKRDDASSEINTWMSTRGKYVPTIIVGLVVLAFIVVLFWT